MTDQTETECLDIAAMTKLAQDFIAELKTLADARRGWNEARAAREANEDTEDEAYAKLRKACRNFIRANPEDGFMGNACDHVAHGYTVVKSRRRTVERLEQKGVDGVGRYTEQRGLELAWYDLDEATAELGNLLGGYKSGLAVKGLHDAYRYFAREAKVVSAKEALANASQVVESTLFNDFSQVAYWVYRAPAWLTDAGRNNHWRDHNPLAARESAAH